MDYTTQPLLFKARKALRYVRLYGPSRTRVKVQAQYHMKKKFDPLPTNPLNGEEGRHVGILGCGKFAFSAIAYHLTKEHGRVLRGVMDLVPDRAASLGEHYGATYYTDDAHEVLADDKIDLVYIASNHASHATYAVEALERGKSVHIEKPHVVTMEQLETLVEAMERSKGRVRLGFNRPLSPIGLRIKEVLDSQPGAVVLNWFVAGHEIEPDHWYYQEAEGGRVLGNLCHWTDFTYQMVPSEGRYPIQVTPARGERPDTDIAVSILFGDGSLGVISFSAKGHVFEGVKERLAAQKGDALLVMDDFKRLRVDVVDTTSAVRHLVRDHGHARSILASHRMLGDPSLAESPEYVWETGELFLKIKESLETRGTLSIDGPRIPTTAPESGVGS